MPVLPRRALFGRQTCCYYINAAKWWLCPVSRRTLLVFSEALICLSYTAVVVPPRGIAPRSPAYRAGALLLSYGGIYKRGRPTR